MTSSVISALFPQLERAEIERAKRKPTENLQAYDYYLRALSSFYEFTREQNIEALRLIRLAVEIDPGLASAYALGAYCYLQRKIFGWTIDADQELNDTRRLARRAIELDKDDPTVLVRAGQELAPYYMRSTMAWPSSPELMSLTRTWLLHGIRSAGNTYGAVT